MPSLDYKIKSINEHPDRTDTVYSVYEGDWQDVVDPVDGSIVTQFVRTSLVVDRATEQTAAKATYEDVTASLDAALTEKAVDLGKSVIADPIV